MTVPCALWSWPPLGLSSVGALQDAAAAGTPKEASALLAGSFLLFRNAGIAAAATSPRPTTTAMTTNSALLRFSLACCSRRIASTRARRSFSAFLVGLVLFATVLSRCGGCRRSCLPAPVVECPDRAFYEPPGTPAPHSAYHTGPVPVVPAARTRTWDAGRPLDLGTTLGPMGRGPGDPTFRLARGEVWRTALTADGPVTTRITSVSAYAVSAQAWGAGAEAALEALPGLLGAGDGPGGFAPVHRRIREAWRRHQGWRVPRSGQVFETLVPAVLEQKVTGREAWRAWRYLVRRYGSPAPGPEGAVPPGLYVVPSAATWRRIPSWEWHRAGVDLSRSRTIVSAAVSPGRLEALGGLAAADARSRLQLLRGVGVWTSAEVAQRALGDPDAVSVGDFHLSYVVGTALVGERVDD